MYMRIWGYTFNNYNAIITTLPPNQLLSAYKCFKDKQYVCYVVTLINVYVTYLHS